MATTRSTNQPPIAGLFPCFSPTSLGGIELSGRLAWEAAQKHASSTHLFLYGAGCQAMAARSNQIVATSKHHAVQQVLRAHWNAETVLIWHVGLLKLLPLFRLRNTRVVLFLHGIEIWRPLDPFTRYLLRKVDLFLSNSDYTWQRFLQFHPPFANHAHRTIHLGLGVPNRHDQPLPDQPPIALIVSRLAKAEDYKGHREMIQAWQHVLTRLPHAQLCIAGEGDLRPILETMVAAHHLTNHVHFLGRISEQEKESLLRRCNCFAMPSQNEGFGLVYLEAMRLGRPCLVSTLDAGQEVISPPEAGLAVDPRNITELAEALVRLLTPDARWRQWSISAKRRYDNMFTAAHFEQRLLAALGLGDNI